MTDNEIIRALECCAEAEYCATCLATDSCKGMESLMENALDLIKRQKAEIDKFNENIARTVQRAVLEEHALITPVIRHQAIKEFAEAVKMEFYREFDEIIPSIMVDRIDNLVKEITEGNHETN